MAQGGLKLKASKAPKKSKPSQQKKNLSKGRKAFAAKGRKATLARQETDTSKAINRKNEATVAARAVGAGGRFYLTDIKEAGKKEIKKKNDALRKKEKKGNNMTERLQEQINKLK
jgi:hypothetical protein